MVSVPNCVGAILCNRPEPDLVPEPAPASNPNPDKNAGTNSETGTIWEQGDCRIQGDYIKSPLRIQKTRVQKIPNTYDGLGRYISWFKRMTANEYIRRVKAKEFPRFEKSIWHRNYYERVIRDEYEWNRIREYIEKNPEMWEEDELNAA